MGLLHGIVAELTLEACLPLSPLGSAHAHDLGGAEGREVVHECDADLDFGSLAVGVSRGDTFPERLEAAHLCLDPASDVISGGLLY